jgi:integrase
MGWGLPKKALSDLALRRIKPPAIGQVDIFDKGYPGFALRVSYGGGMSWVYFYRIGGRLRRKSLGTYPAVSLAEARQLWRDAKHEVSLGRDPAWGGTSDLNFESVAREWLKRDQADKRSYREIVRIVEKELLPAWGHRSIRDIRRHDILLLSDAITDRGAVIMARRVMAYVHRLFRWAKSRDLIDSNPAADLPKPGRETARDRVLSDPELVEVWKIAEKLGWPYGDAVRLLILTGARRAEISELQWSEIHGDTIKLSSARTKNASPHHIPLSAQALSVLSQIPRVAGSEFVFGLPLRSGAWANAKLKFNTLDIPHWRIHDLRRTVATGLQKLGINLQVIEAVLGHTSGSRSGVVGVYQRHSFDAEKRAALEAWGAHVMGLVEARGPAKALPIHGIV